MDSIRDVTSIVYVHSQRSVGSERTSEAVTWSHYKKVIVDLPTSPGRIMRNGSFYQK